MSKKSLGLITVILVALAGPALADAVADGEAGLAALKSGDYPKAITLFTRALKGSQLKGADREFAFLSRGKAYLESGKAALAINDLKMAVKLAPDDSEAADTLAQAQSATPSSVTQADAVPTVAKRGGGWGILASQVDKYYWVQVPNIGPHKYLAHTYWIIPQQTLGYTISTNDGVQQAGEYKLDPKTGNLIEVETDDGGGVDYGTAIAHGETLTQYGFVFNVPRMATTSRSPDGTSYVLSVQQFTNGAWKVTETQTQVEATQADIQSAGFKLSNQ